MNEIHVNDIGTVFTITIREGTAPVDISTATTKNIIFKRQDQSINTVAGSFVTDGSDGQITYSTVSGDLSVSGEYCIQAKIVMPAGTWNSEVDHFDVYKNLI